MSTFDRKEEVKALYKIKLFAATAAVTSPLWLHIAKAAASYGTG
jgi:hypothetical protein